MGKKSRAQPESAVDTEHAASQPAKKQRKAKSSAGLAQPEAAAKAGPPVWRNKEKPLVLCARGITYRYRHLMTDLMQLLPHHKTDSKLDTKHDWNAINEVAELKGATSVMFFEARKRSDLYLWLSKVPSGPSARFLCSNVHTMAELKLSGNQLKGSRPVLSFDAAFDEQPQLQVMKELLQQVFVTPKGHQKSKPFFDHVISFTWCDNRIWLRNYQVVVALDKKKVTEESVTLVEVGPRATLQPIKVFAGSFRGKVLFENPEYINPNAVRAYERRKQAGAYDSKVSQKKRRKAHVEEHHVEEPALGDRKVFAKGAPADAHTGGGELQAAAAAASTGSESDDMLGEASDDVSGEESEELLGEASDGADDDEE